MVCVIVFNKVLEEKCCLKVEVFKLVCEIGNVLILEVRNEEINVYKNSLKILKYRRFDSFEFRGFFINCCFLLILKDIKLLWVIK